MNISQKFFFQEKNSLCQSVSDVSVLYAHALLFQISQMIPDMGQVIHPHVPADLSFVIDLLGQEWPMLGCKHGCGHGKDM